MMLWKWLTYEIDMHRRRNKVLIVIAIWVMATVAWIYLLPMISPAGTWLCTDAYNQQDYVIIHENALAGYTVLILNQETGKMVAESKNNIITAWIWKFNTLNNYSEITPIQSNNSEHK